MKVKLNSKQFTVTVRGEIEDGPVLPKGPGMPWPVKVVEFEATLQHVNTWELRSFTCIGQVADAQGQIDREEDYRYYATCDVPGDAPDWAHRLIARVIPSQPLPVMTSQEFYLP